MLRLLLFLAGIIVLITSEFLKVYYIMPFPGSQEDETIQLAYWLHNNIGWFRLIGVAMIAWPAWTFFSSKKIWVIWPTIVAICVWLFVAYLASFVMLADKMFEQPRHRNLLAVADNKIPGSDLVIGVTINNESKAYPIEVIGYHHQVRDSLGGQPIMVTYCTVCRTGRVFSPIVDGQPETFRLVGMDHFNAMFEDSRTKSWWRQVNGEAIVGESKGKKLAEIESRQMSLNAWIEGYPETKIMQRDTSFVAQYDSLGLYDEGKTKSNLEKRDTTSWQPKSWVVGVQTADHAKAYDWIDLLEWRVINDSIGATPIVVAIEVDDVSFHVWERPDTLLFAQNGDTMMDTNTESSWNSKGECIAGILKGSKLKYVQSYQEYWHSWKTFRPHTTQYRISNTEY